MSTFRFYFFRGSSAGLMKVMATRTGEVNLEDHLLVRCPGMMRVIRGQCRSRLSCGTSRGFLYHAVKIAPLPKTDFLENAAACEPLCAFFYFCDLANQSKFDAKAVK